jgi:tetratricopeptide (TPR) repeat protein
LRPETKVIPGTASRARVLGVGVGLIVAIVTAYHNSLPVPFVFDDPLAIVENPTIRKLWPLSDVILPPRGEGVTVEGRPVLNLTLAVNHAIGGTAVRGYHVVNVAIHALATLTLFGLVRRTLLLPRLRERFGRDALWIAAFVALSWSLHPLQTESVTYVVQRAEALVGLFYLLTLYAFVRGVETPEDSALMSDGPGGPPRRPRSERHPGVASSPACAQGAVERGGRRFMFLAFAACAFGMATKEVMVSAPLLVLLFDRAFLAGTLREAWRQRWPVHLALFSTWILLAALVLRTGTRGGTAGFGINVTPLAYALTQFEAVTRYVWLSLWPHPLIFDYGVDWVENAMEVLPYALWLGVLVAATLIAWRRWPMAGWLGILFFAVLSPTSSIVPGNRQTLAEHRMYLPLASIVVLLACGTYLAAHARRQRGALLAVALMGALAWGALTVRRNVDYRSEIALYHDTAVKRPQNGFARYNLAKALAEAGHHAGAVPEYEAALRLMGDVPGLHYNLANSLAALGRRDEAIAHYEAALRAEPRYARAEFNLGNVLLESGRKEDAAKHFAAAIALEPGLVEARVNLGGVLLELGRLPEARQHFEQVLRSDANHVLALFNLGNACLLEQRWDEAIRHFEKVITLQPGLAIARERLEMARTKAGR